IRPLPGVKGARVEPEDVVLIGALGARGGRTDCIGHKVPMQMMIEQSGLAPVTTGGAGGHIPAVLDEMYTAGRRSGVCAQRKLRSITWARDRLFPHRASPEPPAPPHSLAVPFFLPSACNHLRASAASGHPTRPYPVADRERGPTRSVVWCFAPLAAVRPETGGSLERKSPKTRAPAQMLAALRTPGLPAWQERGGTGSPSMDQAGSARQPSR